MFSEEDIRRVLDEDVITPVAEKMLTLYVGEADWSSAMNTLYWRLEKKHGKGKAKSLIREAISFAILLPAFDKNTKIDENHPENLLFWGMSYHQFKKRDWFAELKDVIKQDARIMKWRKEALSLGVIDPIDYQPFCRQAYNWMCDEATQSGVELTPDLQDKFKKLVMIYGGAVISYAFTKHKKTLDNKVVNWRSGYFMERAIFDIYDIEQVVQIKEQELKKTNSKWVKDIR